MPLNFFSLIKVGVAVAALFCAYWLGLSQGIKSEELKHARNEISTLNKVLAKYKDEQERLSTSLADLRVSESRARDESEWMRRQLSELERKAKSDADRQRNRCLRLAIEGKELLEEASRAIEFCEENHR